MSLRGRLLLAATAAVAIAALLASGLAFLVVRHELRGQIDESLLRRARAPGALLVPRLRLPPLEDIGTFVQVIDSDGNVVRASAVDTVLPVSAEARAVAAGERAPLLADLDVDGTHLRVLTDPLPGRLAVQVARPLTEVDNTLRRVGFILLGVALGGVGLAGALGWLVSRTALRPVTRLTEAVEHVTETADLTGRIEADGDDELARLARRFNDMLAALDASLASQRQLVADASHELRTPLTSLRTNVEVLARAHELEEGDRSRLLADVVAQLEELTELVADLVDLARGAEPATAVEDVRLDLLVERAVERARAHAPGIEIVAALEPTVVEGVPDRLERAAANLLDNAAKWSSPGGIVEVAVSDGELTVRDHGPGIEPEDLPHVFDRFYRSRAARSMPGSGLGLAIVKQVAESHGGEISAENAEGGGARFRLRLGVLP
ncbi:MAG: HAMP domain-containing histidine kinase [Thermoleophilia bacterium]|nr:HAMP domain-containing histidine kinase [Thermoleophilia bacterium]